MSLELALKSKDRPYGLPPLKIYVVNECERVHVSHWEYTESGVIPHNIKKNKCVSVTDGITTSSVTLYENMTHKLVKGHYYTIMNHAVVRNRLNITTGTKIFKSGAFPVPEVILEEAKARLYPPEVFLIPGQEEIDRLVTVSGRVKKVSSVRKATGIDAPIRNVVLDHGGKELSITFWREKVLLQIPEGSYLNISHLKGIKSTYGYRLQSTGFTVIVSPPKISRTLNISGSAMEEDGEVVEVLTAEGEVLTVDRKVWKEQDECDFKIVAEILENKIVSYVKQNQSEE